MSQRKKEKIKPGKPTNPTNQPNITYPNRGGGEPERARSPASVEGQLADLVCEPWELKAARTSK
jgi:hypothetical protein